MLFSILCLALLSAGPDDDLTLKADVSDNGATQFEFISTLSQGRSRSAISIVTETVTNYVAASGYSFAIGEAERGHVPPAGKKDGRVVPQAVTIVRTSYRPLSEAQVHLAGAVDMGEDHFGMAANRWAEHGAKTRAFPDGRLEAKLLQGNANGKVLVLCSSRVSGDAEKGYEYTYTVENHSDKPLRFLWAGLESTVEPGKTFTKTERSGKLTPEEPGLAKLDFGDKREFVIRANFWERPK